MTSISVFRVVAIVALGLFGAGATYAQEEESEPGIVPPPYLGYGVAIPFIFQAPFHFAKGLNPYDALRATNLYTTQDFNWIRDTGGEPGSEVGFDHITIDIDPFCFGFKVVEIGSVKTVVYDPNMNISNAPNPSKASDMIPALNHYIDFGVFEP